MSVQGSGFRGRAMRGGRRVCAALVFVAAGAGVASAQTIGAADWPKENPPRPLPAPKIVFPAYSLKTLPNGLQVLVIPQHEQPSVSMRLIIKAGAAQDPADKPGVAIMAAALLDQGTATKTSEGIANLVESSGGLIGTGAGNELTFVNAGVIKDRFDVMMALMAEMVQQPAFKQEELDRQRDQALSGMQVSFSDPEFVADVVFDRLVYGFHPYGQPSSGTPESLSKLTRTDLAAFQQKWFVPNNALLAIVGDMTTEEMFAGAEKAFGSWARKDVPVQTLPDPPAPTRRVVVIDKPGAVQTEIRAGELTLARTSPDWLALEMWMRVLGGEGGNRLFQDLRSQRGLTYGASAEQHTFKFGGSFVAKTNTRTETTSEALRVLIDEIFTMRRDGPFEAEVGGVQSYFNGSFPLSIESPSSIALQVLNQLFYGLDPKDLDTLRDRVSALRRQDLAAAADKYIKPDRLSMVLVGDASKFIDQLKAQGFDDVERIPIDQLDLSSATLRKGGATAAMAATPDAGDTPAAAAAGLALVRKVAEAKGGLAVLRAVKSVDVSANVTIAGAGERPQTMVSRNLVEYPSKFRVELTAQGNTIAQVFDGERAWVETPAGTMDADAEAKADFRSSAARDLIPLLINAVDGKVPVARMADEPCGSDTCPVLRFRLSTGESLFMVVDGKTSDVRELRYRTGDVRDAPQAVERFDTYRNVSGVRVAFHARLEREGAVVDRTITAAAFNVPIPASMFVKKQP